MCFKNVNVLKCTLHILNFRHGLPSLFGWHTVPADAREIVLTADEFDAMAVYQATSFPAVSLPSGLSSLPPEVWIAFPVVKYF